MIELSLSNISEVADNLATASTKVIKTLHNFVFGYDGDRGNRNRLRGFSGFNFVQESDEYHQKIISSTTTFSLGDLTAICNVLRIDYSGSSDEITRRICDHLINLNLLVNLEDKDDDDEDGIRDAVVSPQFSQSSPQTNTFFMSFRDVEETLRSFSGTNNYSIEAWVNDFEDNAILMGWNELQKLVFAKKLLVGLAKLFVQGERGIKSWNELKYKLTEEFSSKINSAQLHRMLSQRKMKREESVHEYFLIMKELASRSFIETEALIQYIIDGIYDEASKKAILYGARNLQEFKSKLHIYDKIRSCNSNWKSNNILENNQQIPFKKPFTSAPGTDPKCYNCNNFGHMSASCPKPKRPKGSCYHCGSTEHVLRNCPEKTNTKPKPGTTHLIESTRELLPGYTVTLQLQIGEVVATLDTGSPISLLVENKIPKNVHVLPYIKIETFEGVNNSKIEILGQLKQTVKIGNSEIPIIFFIVPNSTMNCSCILGRDFISCDSIQVNFSDSVNIIERPTSKFELKSEENEILHIEVENSFNSLNLNINENITQDIQDQVYNIVDKSYLQADRPIKSETDLEMELILKKDFKPFDSYSTITNKIEGKFHCTDKGERPFYCLHIDHYGPLEKSGHRHKYIFEVKDSFTKFVKFYATTTTKADELIKKLKIYFITYSKPNKIVADRGSAFMSTKFKEFLAQESIQHIAIASGTPHANGQIERVNRDLTLMLCKISASTTTWDNSLPDVEFAINNTINRSTGNTPAKLLFGINQVGNVRDDLKQLLNKQQDTERDLNAIRIEAVENMQKNSDYNEKYYNKKHKTPTKYKLGDYVMIKNVDVTPGVNKKLLPKYRGPYVINRVLDYDRYVITDPEGHQLTQIPFKGVCSPENLKLWVKSNQIN